MNRPRRALLGGLLLAGCAPSGQLVPLAVGKHWNYGFRWGVQKENAPIQVVREVPIADGTGWELSGPMGQARLGYHGGDLVADQLGGAFLTPALPIGIRVGSKPQVWRGWVTGLDGKKPAKAIIVATEAKLPVQGRPRSLNRTVVTMTTGGHTIELTTWYAPGDGIVQQEQRTDETLDVGVERIAG